ncbi:MAG: signal recognition particle protein [Myxococcales bacterium]|nr:signal recognition particle protein [Myxococcales bacterium]
MLEGLTNGFRNARQRLQGKKTLDESTIDSVLQDIRNSLLEADVEFGVVREFQAQVREKALGQVVQTRVKHDGEKHEVTAGEQFIKICHEELVDLMGGSQELDLTPGRDGLTRVMMVGLQGSGKTTTAGKLANLLKREGKSPLLVAADVYRPAAVNQLQVLGERLSVSVYHRAGASPPDLCSEGVDYAKANGHDVVIFDTAGRLTIDEQLMGELGDIRSRTSPENVLLVIDAMIGQDSVRTARTFHDRVSLDGVVLTKLDGDARGGAALSVRSVTGCPILFIGMGEGLDRLERFRPEGMADRILGFGDVVSLVEDFERVVDAEKAEEDAARMLSGQFTFTDFVEQLKTIKKMGPLKDVFEKLPFFNDMMPAGAMVDDRELVRVEAMIQSMTRGERDKPELLQSNSRCRRIAKGSGRTEKDVVDLYGRFKMMRDLMGAVGKQPGLLGNLPGFKQMGQLGRMKNMDMSQLMGGMPGMDAPKRKPKAAPVAMHGANLDAVRKARKRAKKKMKKSKRRRR